MQIGIWIYSFQQLFLIRLSDYANSASVLYSASCGPPNVLITFKRGSNVTVLYGGCVAIATEVLRGVTWSEALDEVFADNYRRDPTLSWQYFGSSSGFFRNYPGTLRAICSAVLWHGLSF